MARFHRFTRPWAMNDVYLYSVTLIH